MPVKTISRMPYPVRLLNLCTDEDGRQRCDNPTALLRELLARKHGLWARPWLNDDPYSLFIDLSDSDGEEESGDSDEEGEEGRAHPYDFKEYAHRAKSKWYRAEVARKAEETATYNFQELLKSAQRERERYRVEATKSAEETITFHFQECLRWAENERYHVDAAKSAEEVVVVEFPYDDAVDEMELCNDTEDAIYCYEADNGEGVGGGDEDHDDDEYPYGSIGEDAEEASDIFWNPDLPRTTD